MDKVTKQHKSYVGLALQNLHSCEQCKSCSSFLTIKYELKYVRLGQTKFQNGFYIDFKQKVEFLEYMLFYKEAELLISVFLFTTCLDSCKQVSMITETMHVNVQYLQMYLDIHRTVKKIVTCSCK